MPARYKLLWLAAAFLAFCPPSSLVAQAKKAVSREFDPLQHGAIPAGVAQAKKPVSLESRVAKLEARIKAQDEEIQSLHALVLALDARSANQDGQIKNLTTLEMTSSFDPHPEVSHYYYWCGSVPVTGFFTGSVNRNGEIINSLQVDGPVSGAAILPETNACFVIIDRKYTTAAKSP